MSLTPLLTTSTRTPKTGPSQPPTPTSAKAASKALTDYVCLWIFHNLNERNIKFLIQQLGDSLGKGAFGQVYRALNWSTGETVAVKEIELSNIPKSELGDIMVCLFYIVPTTCVKPGF
jgi:serine/threonine protein kinase